MTKLTARNPHYRTNNVTFVTERCVIRLTPEGLTVTKIAPGVDLSKEVLDRVDIPLCVSPDPRLMDERLFRPEPMRLELLPSERNPQNRRSNLAPAVIREAAADD